jgi:DNA polymerase/3'-5' exonuclease PolX
VAVEEPQAYVDVNAVVGGYLRDLAFAQSSQQKMFGYRRAATAILSLATPLTDLLGPDGTLPRIPGIGPGSTRVIREILETGGSLPSNRPSNAASDAPISSEDGSFGDTF